VVYHLGTGGRADSLHRTREKVYGTREDFRISGWGKVYVAEEITGSFLSEVKGLIGQRQRPVREDLKRLSGDYTKMRRKVGWEETAGARSARNLRNFEKEIKAIARGISEKGGCAMLFTHGAEEGGLRRKS